MRASRVPCSSCLQPTLLSWLAAVALASGPAFAQDEEDAEPPTIEHEPVEVNVEAKALEVKATIRDDSGVYDPTLLYRIGKEGPFLSITMTAVEGEPDTYRAIIPAELVTGDIEYFLEAFDEIGNGPARAADAELPFEVRVIPAGSGGKENGDGTDTDGKDGDGPDSGGGGSGGGEVDEGFPWLWVTLGVGAVAAAVLAIIAVAAIGTAVTLVAVFVLPGLIPGNMMMPPPERVTITVDEPGPLVSGFTSARMGSPWEGE